MCCQKAGHRDEQLRPHIIDPVTEEPTLASHDRVLTLESKVRRLQHLLLATLGLTAIGVLAITSWIECSEVTFESITTRRLIIESHTGDPWLVAEEVLHEPDEPDMGGNQWITIGKNPSTSKLKCWLDGRGGIQLWIADGKDRERISFAVRGGPEDMASLALRHPEEGIAPAFSASSCNEACRKRLADGQRVLD